jgi:hypothetical protein
MTRYTLGKLRKHSNASRHRVNHKDVVNGFDNCSKYVDTLETEEISLLRNVKMIQTGRFINHCYSSITLLEKSLYIDSILCLRAAMEIFQFKLLLSIDSNYALTYESNNKIRPIDVRKKLKTLNIRDGHFS